MGSYLVMRWRNEELKVNLLSFIPDADIFCARIARYANIKEDWDNMYIRMPKGGWEKFLRKIIKMGHTSALEHAIFTFEITGVSRVTTHQLVRHRMASYLQKSFRKVPPEEMVLPKWRDGDSYVDDMQRRAFERFRQTFRDGHTLEDARYFAPMGSKTAIIVTMNSRQLREVFFPLRLDRHAQWEIRCMANLILREVKKCAPVIFEEFNVDEELLEEYGYG